MIVHFFPFWSMHFVAVVAFVVFVFEFLSSVALSRIFIRVCVYADEYQKQFEST